MINGGGDSISNFGITDIINLHLDHPVFGRRKITTWCILEISNLLNCNLGWSFILVNFLALFLSGMGAYYLSLEIVKDKKGALYSLIIYFFCFSNIFAFFPPVYTYDEPLQYCLLFLSLILFFRQKLLGFVVAFTLTLMVRETAIILLPALFVYFVFRNNRSWNKISFNSLKTILALSIPVVIYTFYFFQIFKNAAHADSSKDYFLLRISRIGYNFNNISFTIETIGAFIIMYAIPVYLIILALKNNNYFNTKFRKWSAAFFLTLIINSGIVLVVARVREIRLLALPLIYLWPVLGLVLKKELPIILGKNNYHKFFAKSKSTFIFFSLTGLNILISFVVYHPTIGPKIGVFNLYMFLSLEAIILHALMNRILKKISLS